MQYITIDSVKKSLGDWSGSDVSIMLANAWLNSHQLPLFDVVPDDVLMAGALIAQDVQNGVMLAGRSEGIVKSKSVQAGDVSSSKTFVEGAEGQAISQGEQQALLLIAPYLVNRYRGVGVVMGRY